ncbi:Hypothetical predicted protein [Paramuricea clavata]|uniref:Uncharacterized protein n=1 Tax=Paramuricea clavata TaxID=317549 RepID=A0A6S7JGH8_PARCT|nr:Hypothetical predicted protein [Paramuricea clavata]
MFAKNRSTEKVHHNVIVKNSSALQPDNSKTIEDDVLLFLRKAISDIRRIKTRPPINHGSGYGSGSGEDRNEGSGGSGGTTDSFSGTGCNDDDEDCSGESSGVESSMFFLLFYLYTGT